MAGTDIVLLSTPLASRALPGGVCPSLSNITLGSYLRAHGASVQVVDPSVDLGFDPSGEGQKEALLQHIVEAALKPSPRMVGVSCLSPWEGRFGVALAQSLARRRPELPVVLGGIWASACAEEIVRRFPEVSAVVRGPGEQAVLRLATEGLGDRALVPGLTWMAGDTLHQNPIAGETHVAPPIDLSLLAHPERYDIFCWLTSRGCPYHCAFCTERVTSPQFLHHPMARVEADIAAFEAAEADWYLWICDPLFGVKRDRLAAVCERLAATPYQFLAESRVDVLHPDDVPRLREAGCTLIYFGLEAIAHRSLCELDKIDDRPGRHRRYLDGATSLVEACVRNDILPVMGVLQPVPGDRPGDLAECLAFLETLAAIPARLGAAQSHGLGPCFHAFPVRFDRGAPYESQEARLREIGVGFTPVADGLFEDRYIADASTTLSAAQAEVFRERVRALNPTAPHVQQRLLRSFPRPYVRFDV